MSPYYIATTEQVARGLFCVGCDREIEEAAPYAIEPVGLSWGVLVQEVLCHACKVEELKR